jgi:hypothetical protein
MQESSHIGHKFYSGSPPLGLRPQRFGFSALLFSFLLNMALRTLHLQSYMYYKVNKPM